MSHTFSMQHASLRAKLLLAFAGMVLLLAAAGGAGLFSVRAVSGKFGFFSEVTLPLGNNVDIFTKGFGEMHVIIMDAMLQDSAQGIDGEKTKLDSVLRDFDEVLPRLPGLAEKAGITFDFGKINEEVQHLRPLSEAFFAACRKKAAEGRLAGERLADFEKERANLDQMLADFTSKSETAMNSKEDSAKTLAQSGNATVADLATALDEVFAEDYPLVKGASALQRYLMQMQDIARSFLAEKIDARLTAMTAEFDKVSGKAASRVSRLAGRAASPEALEKLSGGFKNLQAKVTGEAGLFAQHRASVQAAEEMARIDQETEALVAQIGTDLQALTRQVNQLNDDTTRRVAAGVKTSQYQLALLVLSGVILGFVVIFFIMRGVQTQLGGDPTEIAHIVRAVADCDLTVRFDTSRRLVGVYAAMKEMVEKLASVLKDIDDGTKTLSISSTEMTAIAAQMTQGVRNTTTRTSAVAAAADEMTGNMNAVAASMEAASDNMSSIAASSEEMNASIAEIASNAARAKASVTGAVELSRKASVQVNELGQAAGEISVVSETIKAISDKTNLLALNATIEAARAGEAGKGFAVVANEIKDLAKQTAEATGDIATKLKNIQKATGITVGEIEEFSEAIRAVDELVTAIAAAVEEQSVTTGSITEHVAQAGTGIREINENVNQSSSASKHVADEISEIKAAAVEMSNSSAQVEQNAVNLSDLAENLKTVVARFRV